MMEKLIYITQASPERDHLECVLDACEAGIKLIQLRIKGKSKAEVQPLAEQAKAICDGFKVKLIINDFPEIAAQISAYGVHLGKDDMPVRDARRVVGDKTVIGGTANTFEDILKLKEAGVNYVGLGPFRFTETKENLSPVLGLEGLQRIMNECSRNNITLPIFAIGGIELKDIEGIMQTGIYGISCSSLINKSEDKERTVLDIIKRIK